MGKTVAAFTVTLSQFFEQLCNRFIHVSPLVFLSQFSERPQVCVSVECQQEEASQHGEEGSRLPWRCGAGAASLGRLGSGASELGYRCLRCL